MNIMILEVPPTYLKLESFNANECYNTLLTISCVTVWLKTHFSETNSVSIIRVSMRNNQPTKQTVS
jgi:hypothetical protein